MLSIEQLRHRLNQVFEVSQSNLLAEVISEAYADLVKTSDFNELKEIVRDLAQAQVRTEARVDSLTQSIEALTLRVDGLTQSIEALTLRVDGLTQNMDALTLRVDGLTQNMDALTLRVDGLTQNMEQMALEMKDTRKQLGGLSMTVGYTLENEAYKALPALLSQDYDLVIQGRLRRGYVQDAKGNHLEVNILGDGIQNQQSVKIIGESKSQLSIPEIDRFIRKRFQPLQAVFASLFPILITHMVSGPDVEDYAKQRGIALYYSYDF